MKIVAYVEKIVPVEVEVDDKWKPMEDYGNIPWGTIITDEQNEYFDVSSDDFYNDVCKALEEIGESGHNLHEIDTTLGGIILDDLQEY